MGFSSVLLDDYGKTLDERGVRYLGNINKSCQQMIRLIDDMLNLSTLAKSQIRPESVDLSTMAHAILSQLRESEPERLVEFSIEPGISVDGDPRVLGIVLDNLLSNAWKFTRKRSPAKIKFGVARHVPRGMTAEANKRVYFVRDNGAGFDMKYADRLFEAFQRLHESSEFPGTGIGLATVKRIIRRHGGSVWAESEVNQGATFYFTL